MFNKTITFDMDGTIANLYGVENWLDYLIAENTLPYEIAAPMVDFYELYLALEALRAQGFRIEVVSWSSKNGTKAYNKEVRKAKIDWLSREGIKECFDSIHVVKYGTKKHKIVRETGILFDDDARVRKEWVKHGGIAIDPQTHSILDALNNWIVEEENFSYED